MSILDRMIAATIGWVPRPIVRRIAARYVAGETADDAFAVIRRLNGEGCSATVDVLGEFIHALAEADPTVDAYVDILERIAREGVDANVSIKLSAFGLLIDREAAYLNARRVVARAQELGNFVRIDMEDSACTDATLAIFVRLREEGFSNVGVVLQAYLRRTRADIAALSPLTPSYRLCKGIYVEPPEIAFKDPEEIRASYQEALETMLDAGSPVGIATHDPLLVERALAALARRGTPRSAYEFQMLLGVADGMRRSLVSKGHRLRVYVPFGKDWYGYCVRRLKENPLIGRYVLLGLFGIGPKERPAGEGTAS